jgi:glyoxylase-like metal-dependent hydrolase (beta-lactamase superfamily II)
VKYWPTVFGEENVHKEPRRPEVFGFSFFVLSGDPSSPVVLLGPLQGDSVDHTLFWLPAEKTIVCGDAVYGRSTHVWYVSLRTQGRCSHMLTIAGSRKSKRPHYSKHGTRHSNSSALWNQRSSSPATWKADGS